jgi:hypothetical protein
MVKINSTKLRVEIESWKRSSKSFLEAYKRERRNINVREQEKREKKREDINQGRFDLEEVVWYG